MGSLDYASLYVNTWLEGECGIFLILRVVDVRIISQEYIDKELKPSNYAGNIFYTAR